MESSLSSPTLQNTLNVLCNRSLRYTAAIYTDFEKLAAILINTSCSIGVVSDLLVLFLLLGYPSGSSVMQCLRKMSIGTRTVVLLLLADLLFAGNAAVIGWWAVAIKEYLLGQSGYLLQSSIVLFSQCVSVLCLNFLMKGTRDLSNEI